MNVDLANVSNSDLVDLVNKLANEGYEFSPYQLSALMKVTELEFFVEEKVRSLTTDNLIDLLFRHGHKDVIKKYINILYERVDICEYFNRLRWYLTHQIDLPTDLIERIKGRDWDILDIFILTNAENVELSKHFRLKMQEFPSEESLKYTKDFPAQILLEDYDSAYIYKALCQDDFYRQRDVFERLFNTKQEEHRHKLLLIAGMIIENQRADLYPIILAFYKDQECANERRMELWKDFWNCFFVERTWLQKINAYYFGLSDYLRRFEYYPESMVLNGVRNQDEFSLLKQEVKKDLPKKYEKYSFNKDSRELFQSWIFNTKDLSLRFELMLLFIQQYGVDSFIYEQFPELSLDQQDIIESKYPKIRKARQEKSFTEMLRKLPKS